MKKMLLVILVVLLLPFIVNAKEGDIVFWDNTVLSFENDNVLCVQNNTCDLVRAWITIKKYQVEVEGTPSYGTAIRAYWETTTIDALQKYGYSQQIRGCMFDSRKNSDGSIDKMFGIQKEQFGGWVPFHFPKWVIDSDIADPLYASRPGRGRTFYGLWLDNNMKRQAYGVKKPPTPVLFIDDHPGTAFIWDTNVARNISNEFKLCLYKTAEVPKKTKENNTSFAKPIVCFPWKSIFIYNYVTEKFEDKEEIDPFCKTPLEKKTKK